MALWHMFKVLTFCARTPLLQTCLGKFTTQRNTGIALQAAAGAFLHCCTQMVNGLSLPAFLSLA